MARRSTIFQDINELELKELKAGGNENVRVQNLHQTLNLTKKYDIIDIADPLSSEPFTSSTKAPFSQGRLRLEDIDLNGYPDVFISFLVREKGTQKKSYYSTILLSRPCDSDKHLDPILQRCRVFKEAKEYENVQVLANDSSSLLVPIDIDENGRLDFIS